MGSACEVCTILSSQAYLGCGTKSSNVRQLEILIIWRFNTHCRADFHPGTLHCQIRFPLFCDCLHGYSHGMALPTGLSEETSNSSSVRHKIENIGKGWRCTRLLRSELTEGMYSVECQGYYIGWLSQVARSREYWRCTCVWRTSNDN